MARVGRPIARVGLRRRNRKFRGSIQEIPAVVNVRTSGVDGATARARSCVRALGAIGMAHEKVWPGVGTVSIRPENAYIDKPEHRENILSKIEGERRRRKDHCVSGKAPGHRNKCTHRLGQHRRDTEGRKTLERWSWARTVRDWKRCGSFGPQPSSKTVVYP